MNGVVFQTSATITANREAHGSVVHRMWVCSTRLTTPSYWNMNSHSRAVTAVGIAHGISTAARSSARPRNVLDMMVAMPRPMVASSATVTTVNSRVTPTAAQNCEPRLPVGQDSTPPGSWHCCSSQWV